MCNVEKCDIRMYKATMSVFLTRTLTWHLFIFSERGFAIGYAIAVPSVCNVRAPTQPIENFGNFFTPFGTLAIL